MAPHTFNDGNIAFISSKLKRFFQHEICTPDTEPINRSMLMSDAVVTGGRGWWTRIEDFLKNLAGAGDKGAPRLSQDVSERIRIARPLCIFFMVYVHINPGVAEFDAATHGIRAFDWLRFILADGVGRTSIGLLATVSGFLAISTGRIFPFARFLKKRVNSLILPMAFWSGAILLMYLAGEQVKDGYLEHQVGEAWSWAHVPNWLFGITDRPANYPLGFLRDLFLCAALTPVIIFAMRKAALPVLAILFVLMVTHIPTIFFGNNIPFLYSLGIWLALNGKPMTKFVDKYAVLIVLVFAAYTVGMAALSFYDVLHPEDHIGPIVLGVLEIQRVFGAAAFWAICGWMMKGGIGKFFMRLEPFAFAVFCSHMLVSTFYWIPFSAAFGGYYGDLYPVFFILSTPLVYASVIVGMLVLNKLVPPFATFLNGGRALPDMDLPILKKRPEDHRLI